MHDYIQHFVIFVQWPYNNVYSLGNTPAMIPSCCLISNGSSSEVRASRFRSSPFKRFFIFPGACSHHYVRGRMFLKVGRYTLSIGRVHGRRFDARQQGREHEWCVPTQTLTHEHHPPPKSWLHVYRPKLWPMSTTRHPNPDFVPDRTRRPPLNDNDNDNDAEK